MSVIAKRISAIKDFASAKKAADSVLANSTLSAEDKTAVEAALAEQAAQELFEQRTAKSAMTAAAQAVALEDAAHRGERIDPGSPRGRVMIDDMVGRATPMIASAAAMPSNAGGTCRRQRGEPPSAWRRTSKLGYAIATLRLRNIQT